MLIHTPPACSAGKDLINAEPQLCHSNVGDHYIDVYSELLKTACMQPCDRLNLCICETSFQQPTAAGDTSALGSELELAPTEPVDTAAVEPDDTAAADPETTDSPDTTDSDSTGTTDSDTGLTRSTDTEDLA